MRLIAFYLPQFHSIPENDKWWGEGFTEWVNVKNASPLFEGQNQPRIPLDNNYYNLLEDDVKIWQAQIAKKYGIYGFCYYHYWFDGHMLLEKPMEQMLHNPDVDIPFCICWANENWTNAWVCEKADILISQTYGDEKEWVRHYNYLSQFFKDKRYIKDNNKPLMVIYKPELISCMDEMIDCWQKLAKSEGYAGIDFAYQAAGMDFPEKKNNEKFKYDIEMQPSYANILSENKGRSFLKRNVSRLAKIFKIKDVNTKYRGLTGPKIVDYDKTWETILKTPPLSEKSVPCAFVDFDNTPRRKRQGWMFKGGSVKKFKYYFNKLVLKAEKQYNTDLMFIFAWNEWAEGGYLEPDTYNGYGYLEAINECIKEKKEI